jgi:hypothetical protein
VPAASTTAKSTASSWPAASRWGWPLYITSMPVTRVPSYTSRLTWACGTTNRRRLESAELDCASCRTASTKTGALLNLSKLNRPDAGAWPCTASGASSTAVTLFTPLAAFVKARLSSS